jgi:hypothetical protein
MDIANCDNSTTPPGVCINATTNKPQPLVPFIIVASLGNDSFGGKNSLRSYLWTTNTTNNNGSNPVGPIVSDYSISNNNIMGYNNGNGCIFMGAASHGQDNEVSLGYVCETIYYQNTSLTDSDIRTIAGYLGWKWGIEKCLDGTFAGGSPFVSLVASAATASGQQASSAIASSAQASSAIASSAVASAARASSAQVIFGESIQDFVSKQVPLMLSTGHYSTYALPSPANIKPVVWYDGADRDTIIGANGSPILSTATGAGRNVSTWKDKSGNENDIKSSIDDSLPTYTENTGVQFSSASVGADGSPMINGSLVGRPNTRGGYTIFMVYTPSSGDNTLGITAMSTIDDQTYLSIGDGAEIKIGRQKVANPTTQTNPNQNNIAFAATVVGDRPNRATTTYRLPSTTTATTLPPKYAMYTALNAVFNGKRLLSVLYTDLSGTTTNTCYKTYFPSKGTYLSSTDTEFRTTYGPVNLESIALGGQPRGAGAAYPYSNPLISEVIVYSETLTRSQRDNIEGYLAWKWGIAGNLPTAHPWAPVGNVPSASAARASAASASAAQASRAQASAAIASVAQNVGVIEGLKGEKLPYLMNPSLPLMLGPGDVTSYSFPSNIKPLIWLDAADISTIFSSAASATTQTSTANNVVNYWKDKSGSANDIKFLSASTVARPSIVFNGTVPTAVSLNGCSYIFANSALTSPTLPSGAIAGYTIYMVYTAKYNSTSSFAKYLSMGNATNNIMLGTSAISTSTATGNGLSAYISSSATTSATVSATLPPYTTTAPTNYAMYNVSNTNIINAAKPVISGIYTDMSGSTTAATQTCFNTFAPGTTTGIEFRTTYVPVTINSLALGGLVSGSTQLSYSQPNVCEILIYPQTLTLTQRQNIEGYLSWKWGLQANLPAKHPWASTPIAVQASAAKALVIASAATASGQQASNAMASSAQASRATASAAMASAAQQAAAIQSAATVSGQQASNAIASSAQASRAMASAAMASAAQQAAAIQSAATVSAGQASAARASSAQASSSLASAAIASAAQQAAAIQSAATVSGQQASSAIASSAQASRAIASSAIASSAQASAAMVSAARSSSAQASAATASSALASAAAAYAQQNSAAIASANIASGAQASAGQASSAIASSAQASAGQASAAMASSAQASAGMASAAQASAALESNSIASAARASAGQASAAMASSARASAGMASTAQASAAQASNSLASAAIASSAQAYEQQNSAAFAAAKQASAAFASAAQASAGQASSSLASAAQASSSLASAAQASAGQASAAMASSAQASAGMASTAQASAAQASSSLASSAIASSAQQAAAIASAASAHAQQNSAAIASANQASAGMASTAQASAAQASSSLASAAQASSGQASAALASAGQASSAQGSAALASAGQASAAAASSARASSGQASAAIASAAQGLVAIGVDPVNGKYISESNALDQTITIGDFSARYVRIRPSLTNGDGIIHLSQIMVMDNFNNNLATAANGASVYASSTMAAGKPASIVIDGTTTTRNAANIWNATTSNRGTEFIEVDLGSVQTISAIRLIGRSDCPLNYPGCAERMRNLRIEMNESTSSDVLSKQQAAAATASMAAASAATASALRASAASAGLVSMGNDPVNGKYIASSNELDQTIPVNEYSARYVRIRPSTSVADGFIHLSQIMVLDGFGNNMAVGTNVYASSTMAAAKPASVVTDGTTTTRTGANSWNAATANRATEFIEVDLGAVQTISAVRLIGRSDCPTSYVKCADRMMNLRVQMSETTTPDVTAYYNSVASKSQASAAAANASAASAANAAQAFALQASAAAASAALGSAAQASAAVQSAAAGMISMGSDPANGKYVSSSNALDQNIPIGDYPARYVRIRPSLANGDGFIHFSQIMVLDGFGNNMALASAGANVYASSTVPASKPASVVIDGTTSTRTGLNSWNAVSANRNTEFIEIDLGSVQTIGSIRVIGRSDCPANNPKCADRMMNLRIQMSETTTPEVTAFYGTQGSKLQASAAAANASAASAANAATLQASTAVASAAQASAAQALNVEASALKASVAAASAALSSAAQASAAEQSAAAGLVSMGSDPTNGKYVSSSNALDQTIAIADYPARYVRIRPATATGDGFIHFSQIMVMDNFGNNMAVAQGTNVYASSTVPASKPASVVIDGTMTTRTGANSWNAALPIGIPNSLKLTSARYKRLAAFA